MIQIEGEAKERRIVLTDANNLFELRRYIEKHEEEVIRPLKAMWKKQSEGITLKEAERAIQLGGVPSEWQDKWSEEIREFVREELLPEWVEAIYRAGSKIAKKINSVEWKEFQFSTTHQQVQNWVNSHGGELIVQLTAEQSAAVQAVLEQFVIEEPTTPYQLAIKLKEIVGLTKREAMAVVRFYNSLKEEGVSQSVLKKQVGRYAEFLRKNRAMRISRTELSFAYNKGQLYSIQQASESGYIQGEVRKIWLTSPDDRLCDICEPLDGEEVSINESFSIGLDAPPAHPHCRCSVSYQVRR